jgi:hypothetical protein
MASIWVEDDMGMTTKRKEKQEVAEETEDVTATRVREKKGNR